MTRRRTLVALALGLAVGAAVGTCSAAGRRTPSADPRPREWSSLQLMTEAIETVFYDAFSRLARPSLKPNEALALVQISDNDLYRLYKQNRISWPWPRTVFAKAVEAIRDAGARAIVFDVTLTGAGASADDQEAADDLSRSRVVFGIDALERTRDPGESFRSVAEDEAWGVGPLRFKSRRNALLASTDASAASVQPPARSPVPVLVPREVGWDLWVAGFPSAASAEENLATLSGIVGQGASARKLEPDELRFVVTTADLAAELYAVEVAGAERLDRVPTFGSVNPPSELLLGKVPRFGVVTSRLEPDGVFRRAQYLAAIEDPESPGPVKRHYLPSLALATAMEIAGARQVAFEGSDLVVGPFRVPVESDASALVELAPDTRQVYPMIDVLRLADPELAGAARKTWSEKLASVVKDRIVLVSNEAQSMGDIKATPVDAHVSGTRIVAAQLTTLLRGTPIRRVSAWLDLALCLFHALANAFLVGILALRSDARTRHYLATILTFGALAAVHFAIVALAFLAHRWVGFFAPVAAGGIALAASLVYAISTVSLERARIQEVFGRHTSPGLAAHLREHPEDLNAPGEVKNLSVYFSDIQGFTTLSEQIDPKDTVEFLHDYFDSLADIVVETKGIVDKFIGDAIMAFWGAMPPVEEHAQLACTAAIAMRDKLAVLRPELKRKYEERYRPRLGPGFHFDVFARAGLATGPMVVGHIGSRKKRNYTVVGDTVNLASRLEGANKLYGTEILCAEGTFLAARDAFGFREVGVVKVKGKAKGVRIYELLGRLVDLPTARARLAGTFESALRAFTARRFSEAREGFEAALADNPADGPSRLYLDIAKGYAASPPGPDWDGTIEMHEK